MKKILAFFLLIPSLAPALWVESADSGIGGGIRRQEVPSVVSLQDAFSLKPEELAPIKEGLAFKAEGQREIRAVNLMFQGRYAEAIPDLEYAAGGALHFGTYENMVVANELAGDYKQALAAASTQNRYYSRKNPKPPVISIAVLQAKIKAGKTGKFIGPILDIPETVSASDLIRVNQEIPDPDERNRELYSAIEVKKALFEELKNRMVFYKPKDAYVADLLYSYALLEANLGSPRAGLGALNLAEEYGFPDHQLIQVQQKRFQQMALVSTLWIGLISILSLAASLLLLRYVLRRNWHVSMTRKSRDFWESQRQTSSETRPQLARDRF